MVDIVYVIVEHDPKRQETDVIGVASSQIESNKMIDEYYRNYEVLHYNDVRDGGIEWVKRIKIYPDGSEYELTLMDFRLDSI